MRAMHTMHTTSTLLRVELSAHAATLRTFAIVVAVFARRTSSCTGRRRPSSCAF